MFLAWYSFCCLRYLTLACLDIELDSTLETAQAGRQTIEVVALLLRYPTALRGLFQQIQLFGGYHTLRPLI